MRLILAPGVIFDKEAHTYYYKGKQLSGVTKIVGMESGYGKMTSDMSFRLSEVRDDGLHVHEAIENWIESGFKDFKTIHPGANFVKDKIEQSGITMWQAETLVSDFKTYASPVDIISVDKNKKIRFYDIKRAFNRNYVTMQLSIYKYLAEKYAKIEVEELICYSTKDLREYPLEYIGAKEVRRLLYGKK